MDLKGSKLSQSSWPLSFLLSIYGRLFKFRGPRNGGLRPLMRGVRLQEAKNIRVLVEKFTGPHSWCALMGGVHLREVPGCGGSNLQLLVSLRNISPKPMSSRGSNVLCEMYFLFTLQGFLVVLLWTLQDKI